MCKCCAINSGEVDHAYMPQWHDIPTILCFLVSDWTASVVRAQHMVANDAVIIVIIEGEWYARMIAKSLVHVFLFCFLDSAFYELLQVHYLLWHGRDTGPQPPSLPLVPVPLLINLVSTGSSVYGVEHDSEHLQYFCALCWANPLVHVLR